jgi:hypothetical protein
MATITLDYNPRNHIATKIVGMILELDDVFKVKTPSTTNSKTSMELALEDMEKGRVYTAYTPKNRQKTAQ